MDANFEERSTAQLPTACGHMKQFMSLIGLGTVENDIKLRREKTERKKRWNKLMTAWR